MVSGGFDRRAWRDRGLRHCPDRTHGPQWNAPGDPPFARDADRRSSAAFRASRAGGNRCHSDAGQGGQTSGLCVSPRRGMESALQRGACRIDHGARRNRRGSSPARSRPGGSPTRPPRIARGSSRDPLSGPRGLPAGRHFFVRLLRRIVSSSTPCHGADRHTAEWPTTNA